MFFIIMFKLWNLWEGQNYNECNAIIKPSKWKRCSKTKYGVYFLKKNFYSQTVVFTVDAIYTGCFGDLRFSIRWVPIVLIHFGT